MSQKLSHAYIISGAEDLREKRADELCMTILCENEDRAPCGQCRHCQKLQRHTHPDRIDIYRLTDDKGKQRREIVVDQIRQLIADAAIVPNEARGKVYVVHDAGTMNPNAQNAFLKMLEEPPLFDTFLLLCESPTQLLETVRSRCVLEQLAIEEGSVSAESMQLAETYIACIAKRDPVALLSFCNHHNTLTQAECTQFTEAVIQLLSDMLYQRRPDLQLPVSMLLYLSQLMERTAACLRANVGIKHIFGMLAVRSLPLRRRSARR